MPTYEYACTACGHRLDAVQKFSDDPLTDCPECGGALRKVYGAVGIVLKGSGFYKNDSRSGGGAAGKKDGDVKETVPSESKPDTSTKPEPSTSSSSESTSTPSAPKDAKAPATTST